jgi:mRNA interferase MazF
MEQFVKGDIVVVPFPFSDLSGSKKRPALVLADLSGADIILCQITSQSVKDDYAVVLPEAEVIRGNLKMESNIRPNRIFTTEKSVILYKVGGISARKFKEVRDKIMTILDQ